MASTIQEFREAARREPAPSRIAYKLPQYVQVPNLLAGRSLGLRTPLGFTDAFIGGIYNSFDVVNTYGPTKPKYTYYQGGVFNLEFSLDGGLLVAACEGKQILLFDSGNQKLIHEVENAHYNCVNCIKFLSHNSFATGSDDSLINLWDVRNLRKPTKILSGHTSWVKNIEWSEQERVMVTSAFDGTIHSWNLNELDEGNPHFHKVFLMKGLMRMKLTPDGTKMVISTTNGYLIIIHDLDLNMLAKDLKSFRPDIYRLMQMGHQVFPGATKYNYLFSPNQKRNRIEFIEDFPNDAEVISSLQIHPHGWSAVTRNLNSEENEEWTAVHDIQDKDPKEYEEAFEYVEECEMGDESDSQHDPVRDLWMGFIPMANYYTNNDWHPRPGYEETNRLHTGLIGMQDPSLEGEDKNKIVNNLKRLTHYVKEQNVGKGFIKVLAFSPDGRIICSPYGKGMRLLAFNDKCQELSDCVPEEPRELNTVLEVNDYHTDIVLSCRFSPTHYQLVTGCLGSEIKWYQPVL